MTDSFCKTLFCFIQWELSIIMNQPMKIEESLVTKTLLQHTAPSDRHLSVFIVSFSESEVV